MWFTVFFSFWGNRHLLGQTSTQSTECSWGCLDTTLQSGAASFWPQPRPLHPGQLHRALTCPAKPSAFLSLCCLANFPSWLSSFLSQVVSSLLRLLPELCCILSKLLFKLRALSILRAPGLRLRVLSSFFPLCDFITTLPLSHGIFASVPHCQVNVITLSGCHFIAGLCGLLQSFSTYSIADYMVTSLPQ